MTILDPSPSLPQKTSVFVVDDHPLVRDWLSRLINEEPDLEVCGWADTTASAKERIAELSPGLIVVDIGLPGVSGLDLIRSLTDEDPDERILVLSMHDEAVYASRAFKAGARGYVSKRETSEKVVLALRRILAGGVYMNESSHESESSLRQKTGPLGRDVSILSDRELEVFRLLAAGRETVDIARELSVSLKTVQSFCARIKEKLNLRNATELLQAATRWADAQTLG